MALEVVGLGLVLLTRVVSLSLVLLLFLFSTRVKGSLLGSFGLWVFSIRLNGSLFLGVLSLQKCSSPE